MNNRKGNLITSVTTTATTLLTLSQSESTAGHHDGNVHAIVFQNGDDNSTLYEITANEDTFSHFGGAELFKNITNGLWGTTQVVNETIAIECSKLLNTIGLSEDESKSGFKGEYNFYDNSNCEGQTDATYALRVTNMLWDWINQFKAGPNPALLAFGIVLTVTVVGGVIGGIIIKIRKNTNRQEGQRLVSESGDDNEISNTPPNAFSRASSYFFSAISAIQETGTAAVSAASRYFGRQ